MRKKTLIIVAIILLVVFGRLIYSAASLTPVLFQLLFNKEIELKKTNERINVLLLGIGGGAHEGPNLSDTIIFASINLKENTVTLVSIPRDLWIPDLSAKINTAYAFGEEKKENGGLLLSKAVVKKVLEQPIDYAVRVDFDGFIKAVDLLGGIDVNVENGFDDYEYPLAGKENDTCGHTPEEVEELATSSSQLDAFPCRYKHLHFDKGQQHMDGKTALEFVRSRHAIGSEGTDFARSKRQEKVISATKNKVFSLGTLLNPVKVFSLYDAVRSNVATDVEQSEFDDFIKLAQKLKDAKIQSYVVDIGDEEKNQRGLLVNPPVSAAYGNQWVLIPRAGSTNFSEVSFFVGCLVKTEKNCSSPALTVSPTPIPVKRVR